MNRIMLEKIAMPDAETFYREYMCKLKPVVISDFFRNEPIRKLCSRADVIQAWGQELVGIQDEYGKAYRESTNKTNEPGSPGSERMMTIAEYYAFVDCHRDTKQMCIEFPTPKKIQEYFQVPPVCTASEGESTKFVNQCFIGNEGNHAQIHFDKAGLHGFLYQVFGKKRFITFPHSASPKLAPFTQLGTWNLQAFSDSDRRAFLEFTGGAEVELDTGDCFYVPSLSWHFVQYVEDSMSISLRFRRPDHVTSLVNALFPDMYMQGIAYKLADPQDAQGRYRDVLETIKGASASVGADGREHVKKMRALARDIHGRLYPEMPKFPYTFDFEEFLPNPLEHCLDAHNPKRPRYS